MVSNLDRKFVVSWQVDRINRNTQFVIISSTQKNIDAMVDLGDIQRRINAGKNIVNH